MEVAPVLPDFDPATVVDWWQDVYTPLLNYHAYNVAMKTWDEIATDGRQPLTEVCEEGQECRNKVDDWMREEIQKTWKVVLDSLRTTLEATKTSTQAQVEIGWQKKIECELNHPCCEYDEN